jgi:hypothetical protein
MIDAAGASISRPLRGPRCRPCGLKTISNTIQQCRYVAALDWQLLQRRNVDLNRARTMVTMQPDMESLGKF